MRIISQIHSTSLQLQIWGMEKKIRRRREKKRAMAWGQCTLLHRGFPACG
jgi:hypothetical protein